MKLPVGDWLDRRLVRITQLAAGGYDDAHREFLPLIVPQSEGRAGPAAVRTIFHG